MSDLSLKEILRLTASDGCQTVVQFDATDAMALADEVLKIEANPQWGNAYSVDQDNRMWKAATRLARHLQAAVAEVERLRGVIAQHNLCHDLHGKVGVEDFAKGCEAEITRIYGRCPWTERIADLEAASATARDKALREARAAIVNASVFHTGMYVDAKHEGTGRMREAAITAIDALIGKPPAPSAAEQRCDRLAALLRECEPIIEREQSTHYPGGLWYRLKAELNKGSP